MQLVTNEIDPDSIRTETFQGREFLVAPVVPIRAMNLDGGYVPRDHVKKTAKAWNGTPVTLNHPTDENGRIVSANSPDVAEKTWLGHVFNNTPVDDGEMTKGEIWIDIANARELGGEAEQVVDDLQSGNPVSVSTSYFGDRLPAGNYDGEHRDQVVGNLRPDHLALLPNKEGKCSIEDGCVAGEMAANSIRVAMHPDDPEEGEVMANKSVAGVSFSGTSSGKLDESALDADELDLGDHYLYGSGDSKSDFSYPVVDADGNLRKGNVESAWELGCRGDCPSEDEHDSKLMKLGQEFDSPPNFVEQAENALSRALGALRNAFTTRDPAGQFKPPDDLDEGASVKVKTDSGRVIEGTFQGTEDGSVLVNDGDRTWHLTADTVDMLERQATNDDTTMTDRDQMVNELVEDHGFKEESLDGMGDECLERTYESFNETTESPEGDEPEGDELDDEDLEEIVEARVEERIDERVDEAVEEALAANREAETRQELIDEIVANSDWEEDGLDETPVDVLKNIRDDVTSEQAAANYRGQPGADPGAGGSDGAEDFPSLVASKRIAEVDD